MKKILMIVLVLMFAIVGCTNEPDTRSALESMGYTDIAFTGYEFYGCGKGDVYSTGFEATGPTGKKIKGVGCSGFFKGTTIRFK
jgi:hypothetical protein